MVTLIRGGFQSGKTALVLSRVLGESGGGRDPLVIVPSRPQKESFLQRICDSGGIAGRPVLTLTEAVSQTLDRTALLGPLNPVSDFESFILFTLVFEECRPRLSFFGRLPSGSGTIHLLYSIVTRTRSARLNPLPQETGSGHPKWKDIRELRASYDARLSEAGLLDSHEILARAAERAGCWTEKSMLVWDGFHDFTPSQWEFVLAITGDFLRRGLPVLTALPDGPSPLIDETVRKFTDAFECETVRTDNAARPAASGLAAAFLNGSVLADPETRPVTEIIPAFGAYREMERCANEIRRLVLEEGYSYSDIAVIHPSPDRYADAVRSSFAAMDVPAASGKDDPLRGSPVIVFLHSVLNAVLLNGALDTVGILSLARSGYLTNERYRALASLPRVLDAYFSGNEQDWLRELDTRAAFYREVRAREFLGEEENGSGLSADELTARIGALENLRPVVSDFLGRLFSLPEEFSMDEFLQWLSALLAEFGVRESLASGTGSDHSPSARDFTAFRKLNDVLFSLKKTLSVFGREKFRRAEFFRLFDQLTGSVSYRWQIPPADAVRFLSPTDAREQSFRAVFIPGLNEGEFPGRTALSLLDAREKKSFNELARGIVFEDEDSRRSGDRFEYALALGRARERLYLCHTPCDENGREIPPSLYLLQTLKALGTTPENSSSVPVRGNPEELIPSVRWMEVYDRRAIVTADADLLTASDRARLSREFPFLENAARMTDLARERGRVNDAYEKTDAESPAARSVYFGDLDFRNPTPLNDRNARAVREKASRATVSSSFLETFGNCRYRFFLRYILSINEETEPTQEIRSSFKGLFYHAVLRDYAEQTRDVPGDAILADTPRYDRILDGILENRYREFLNKEGEKDLFALEKEYFRSVLKQFIRFDAEHLRSEGRVLETEKSVGGPLDLGAGQSVPLTGRIDRVDESEQGGSVRIIDYKSGSVRHFQEDFRIPLKLFQGFVYARACGRPVGSVSYVSVEKNAPSDRRAVIFPYRKGPRVLDDFGEIWRQKSREIIFLFGEMEKGFFSPFTVLSDYPGELLEFYRRLEKDGAMPDAESDRKCARCPYADACPRGEKKTGWN